MKTSLLKRLRPASIRARITALIGSGTALLMLFSVTLLTWNANRSAVLSANSSLAATALSLREPLGRNASLGELADIVDSQNQTVLQGGILGGEIEAWLLSPQGQVKWVVGPWMGRRPSPYGEIPVVAGEDGTAEPRDSHAETVPPQAEAGLAPLLPDRHHFLTLQRGADTLVLTVPWRRTDGVLREQALSLGALGALATVFASVGAWFLVGKTLAPIEKLALQARSLAQHASWNGRLQATSSDAELQQLTNTLNEMLDGLGEAARSKERFHAAASHELRTPLQALLGHLQVALSRSRSAEEYRGALEESERQTRRLSSLTRELLLLNQLQMATTKPPGESVEVTETVAQTIDFYAARGAERGLKIKEKLTPFEIEGVYAHLEMLLHNIIENAIKYALPQSNIVIEAVPSRLVVWNATLPGQLREADLRQLFDPFFRPDDARHSSTGGNGLGLSICQALCEANGWKIALQKESREYREGLKVVVFFR